MNWDRAAGEWKQLKGKVKQKWAKLTDDDFKTLLAKELTSLGYEHAVHGEASWNSVAVR